MREGSKAAIRRKKEGGYWNRVFVGKGLDIGPGDDPCNREFPWSITELERFDLDRGDANYIRQHFHDEEFDFIHSSHSLEHMKRHPWICAQDWACLLRIGGHLIITVPDFEMYEKKCWPSRYNSEHRCAFYTETIPNQPRVLKMTDIIPHLQVCGMEVLHVNRLTDRWNPRDYSDQTMSFEAGVECAWEVLAVKKAHIKVKTPISIRRQWALGDTIAVSAFYNHLSDRHSIVLQTSPEYVEYHRAVTAIPANANPVDVNLDGYDRINPYVPLYQLGFHLTRIPVPAGICPRIRLSESELLEVQKRKSMKYVVIDVSPIRLKSRAVKFDHASVAAYLKEHGYQVRYLSPMRPRDLILELAGSSLVIGRDSGPIQLAQALDTPFIAFMSSVKPETRYVSREHVRTLTSPCPIQEDGCYHRRWYSQDCPIPMGNVAPCGIVATEDIIGSIKEILK